MANSLTRPLRAGAKAPYLTDKVQILQDGNLCIIRHPKSGGIWSVRFYVGAGRSYQRSLKTKDLDAAKKLAIHHYANIVDRQQKGEPVTAATVNDLVKRYLAHEEQRVIAGGRQKGGITKGRFGTIKTAMGHLEGFLGPKTRLEKIPANKFQGYYAHRLSSHPKTRNSTLKNEKSMLTTALQFGSKNGFFPSGFSPEFPRTIGKTERRDAFRVEEWLKITRYLEKWESQAEDGADRFARRVMKYYMLIGVSSGLRPGKELDKLTWSMVELGKARSLTTKKTVKIYVPEDTKTGNRQVQALGGELFEELRRFTGKSKPDDLVFVESDGRPLREKTRNALFKLILQATGLDGSGKNFKVYSLRHTYCTFRLMEKCGIHLLAKNMGVSIKYISEHYDHVHVDMMVDELTKDTELQRAMEASRAGLDVNAVRSLHGQYFESGPISVTLT